MNTLTTAPATATATADQLTAIRDALGAHLTSHLRNTYGYHLARLIAGAAGSRRNFLSELSEQDADYLLDRITSTEPSSGNTVPSDPELLVTREMVEAAYDCYPAPTDEIGAAYRHVLEAGANTLATFGVVDAAGLIEVLRAELFLLTAH